MEGREKNSNSNVISTPFGDLPRSSVLDRARMFLPQLQQSNQELFQKLEAEGQDAYQIDMTLEEEAPQAKVVEEYASAASDDEASEDEDEISELQQQEQQPAVIQLQFALGDFDGTAIANLEDEDDEEEPTDTSIPRDIIYKDDNGDDDL